MRGTLTTLTFEFELKLYISKYINVEHKTNMAHAQFRAGPQTEKWENLNGTKFCCCL